MPISSDRLGFIYRNEKITPMFLPLEQSISLPGI